MNNIKTKTNLDDILEHVGSFGFYQKLQFLLVGFLAIVPSMVAYSYVFESGSPRFTCSVVKELSLSSKGNVILKNANNIIMNKDLKKFEDLSLDQAEIMEETKHLIRLISKETIENDLEMINFDNNCKIEESQILTDTLKKLENQTLSHPGKKRVKSSYKCVEWVYDNSLYGRTTVTDFNLVCLDSHLKALTQNTFILGTGCSVFTGIISDKFGRRSALILMITILVVTLNATQFLMHTAALTRNQKFTIFTISRFFQGVGTTFYSVSFVLLLEITGAKHRVTAGNILAYSFSIGQMILVGVAYLLKDWLKIKWVISLYVLPFLMYYWLVPESPRWLLSMHKIKQAGLVINKINRINNTYENFIARLMRLIHLNRLIRKNQANEQSENENGDKMVEDENSWMPMFSILQEESSKLSVLRTTTSYKHAIDKILKSRILIKRCLILFYVWMVILAVYLGISGGIVSNLDRIFDPYLIFFIAAIFEFLSIVTVHLVLNWYGRKYPLVIFMLMSSISIYLIPYFLKSQPILTLVFYFISKYAISAAQATCMIFTSELYPTPIRSTGVGLSFAIARLGGLWSPQINVLSFTFDSIFVPFFIFSINGVIAAILCLLLPETLNKKLPETTTQAKALKKKSTNR